MWYVRFNGAVLAEKPLRLSLRAMRTMGIDYATMRRLKNICRRQQDGEQIKGQIDEVYRRFTTKQMINQVEMIRLVDLAGKE